MTEPYLLPALRDRLLFGLLIVAGGALVGMLAISLGASEPLVDYVVFVAAVLVTIMRLAHSHYAPIWTTPSGTPVLLLPSVPLASSAVLVLLLYGRAAVTNLEQQPITPDV